MKLFFLVFLTLIFPRSGLLYAQHSSSEVNEPLEADINFIMQKLDVVGLSVVAVKKGKIVYNQSFGFKTLSPDGNIPLKNNDVFRIASISKVFVATAVFQLIEEGRLHLEDDVNRFLKFRVANPSFESIPITIKMLLSHRSSINDSQGYYTFDHIDPTKNENFQACYNDYAPGADYKYCNYNYNILGAIVEEVSGERFDDYIERNVTNPLDIECSYNVNRLDSSLLVPLYRYNALYGKFMPVPDVYKPYSWHLNNKNYKLGQYTPLFAPTSGMKISATGLANFMIMHMKGGMYNGIRVISQESESLMRTGIVQQSNYAFSFRKYTGLIPRHIMYGQTGGAYGLFSAMIFDPKEDFGFVVITNGCNSVSIDGYADLHKSVINCLYKNIIEKQVEDASY